LTDIGLTGGGKDTHQIYLSGMADHRLQNGDLVDHVVSLVEERAQMLLKAREDENKKG
jgi:(E)-4-hydroxy-3-methylbut-2-enyl-diphosphate synthase